MMTLRGRIIFATIVFLAVMLVVPSSLVGPSYAQQIPGAGISQLVCVLGVHGVGTYGRGGLIVTVQSDVVVNGIGTATVTIQHGTTSSTHVVTYQDTNNSGELDCGDAVISVT